MPSEGRVLVRPRKARAYQAPILALADYAAPVLAPRLTIGEQDAIILRDAGRALLAVAACDAHAPVPELAHLTALRDFQDDLFVAGYLDDTFQKQVDTEFLAGDLRDLAHALTAIERDASLSAFEEIVSDAWRVASNTPHHAVSALAWGISRVVARLVEELRCDGRDH